MYGSLKVPASLATVKPGETADKKKPKTLNFGVTPFVDPDPNRPEPVPEPEAPKMTSTDIPDMLDGARGMIEGYGTESFDKKPEAPKPKTPQTPQVQTPEAQTPQAQAPKSPMPQLQTPKPDSTDNPWLSPLRKTLGQLQQNDQARAKLDKMVQDSTTLGRKGGGTAAAAMTMATQPGEMIYQAAKALGEDDKMADSRQTGWQQGILRGAMIAAAEKGGAHFKAMDRDLSPHIDLTDKNGNGIPDYLEADYAKTLLSAAYKAPENDREHLPVIEGVFKGRKALTHKDIAHITAAAKGAPQPNLVETVAKHDPNAQPIKPQTLEYEIDPNNRPLFPEETDMSGFTLLPDVVSPGGLKHPSLEGLPTAEDWDPGFVIDGLETVRAPGALVNGDPDVVQPAQIKDLEKYTPNAEAPTISLYSSDAGAPSPTEAAAKTEPQSPVPDTAPTPTTAPAPVPGPSADEFAGLDGMGNTLPEDPAEPIPMDFEQMRLEQRKKELKDQYAQIQAERLAADQTRRNNSGATADRKRRREGRGPAPQPEAFPPDAPVFTPEETSQQNTPKRNRPTPPQKDWGEEPTWDEHQAALADAEYDALDHTQALLKDGSIIAEGVSAGVDALTNPNYSTNHEPGYNPVEDMGDYMDTHGDVLIHARNSEEMRHMKRLIRDNATQQDILDKTDPALRYGSQMALGGAEALLPLGTIVRGGKIVNSVVKNPKVREGVKDLGKTFEELSPKQGAMLGGGIGAGMATGEEIVRHATDPDRTAYDSLQNIATSTVGGVVGGGTSRQVKDKAKEWLQNNINSKQFKSLTELSPYMQNIIVDMVGNAPDAATKVGLNTLINMAKDAIAAEQKNRINRQED